MKAAAALPRAIPALPGPLDGRLQAASDFLWTHLAGISWVGFYTKVPDADEMVLTARRDKPACSPIGLHGICGLGWRERRAIIVRDVAILGTNYIACDPRDRSELVVPLFDERAECSCILDIDSHDTDAFDLDDAHQIAAFLAATGLSRPHDPARGVIVI